MQCNFKNVKCTFSFSYSYLLFSMFLMRRLLIYYCSVEAIVLNLQSHSREATGTVTPFDKYAESKSRSNCCAVTVAKRLLPNFVKYAEAQSRSDCYAVPTRRSRQQGISVQSSSPDQRLAENLPHLAIFFVRQDLKLNPPSQI